MGGDFKRHGEKDGPRLRWQQESGLTAIQRRYVDGEPERPERVVKEVMPLNRANTEELSKAPNVGARHSGARGRGRPRVEGVRPWVAEGLSRTEYYRRKAKGLV